MKEIFSSGGGTQSACIAALIVQGRIPKPDLVVIADTGREHSAVWEYLDATIRPALDKVGLEVHRVLKNDWANCDLYDKAGIKMPMFVNRTGGTPGKNAEAKLRTFCSSEWKVRPIERWLRARGIMKRDYRKWIGFSMDEQNRATRMLAGEDGQAGRVWFPLIQGVPLNRHEAIRLVERMGWPTPPRSACWMCPHHSDHEWRNLKLNYPDEFRAAVVLERSIRHKDPGLYLHRSCVTLDKVDLSRDDLFSDGACESGVCFV